MAHCISENSRKLYVADLANDVHCDLPPEALMNTVSSYEAVYWLEQISYNFLICSENVLGIQLAEHSSTHPVSLMAKEKMYFFKYLQKIWVIIAERQL